MFRRSEGVDTADPFPEVMPTVGATDVSKREDATPHRGWEIQDRDEAPSPGTSEAAPSLEAYPPIRVEVWADQGNGTVGYEQASHEITEMAYACYERTSRAMLDLAPPYEGDIEVAKVDAFLAESGLRTLPAVTLSPDQLPEYANRLKDAGVDPTVVDAWPEGQQGVYDPAYGVVIVCEDKTNETAPSYDGAYTLVHEKAHSSMKVKFMYNPETDRLTTLQGGFMHWEGGEARGSFFEHGYACMKAHEYVTSQLDAPTGMLPDIDPASAKGYLARYSLPAAYVLRLENGKPFPIAPSSFAGHGMELLCKSIPALGGLFDESRASFAGLHAVRGAIDTLAPGLYDFLDSLPGSWNGYVTGLRSIQDVLKGKGTG